MISKELSDKIKVCGLCCAMIVVLRHSLNLQAFFGTARPEVVVADCELFISKMTEMAVPYFFIISGFFFLRENYYGWHSYANMLSKKARTLLIPYVAWVVIGHIIMIPVGLGELPTTIGGIARAFWDAECAGGLWYVRSLVLMMILYPVYGWIFLIDNKLLCVLTICVAFFVWMPVDMRPLSTEGILFFLLGGVLQKYSLLGRYRISNSGLVTLLLLWVLCSFFSLSFALWPNRVNTVLGVIVVWFGIDRINRRSYRLLLNYASLAFFVYVMHIYILKLLKFSVARYFFGNGTVALISFFILPAITVATAVFLGMFIKKQIPSLFGVITGGRS